jgi:hypothetical protein
MKRGDAAWFGDRIKFIALQLSKGDVHFDPIPARLEATIQFYKGLRIFFNEIYRAIDTVR